MFTRHVLGIALALLLAAAPVAAQSERPVRSWDDFRAGLAEYSSVMESMDVPDASDPFVTSAFLVWGLRGFDATAMTLWLLEADPEPCYAGVWGASVAWASSLAHIAYMQGMAKIAIWPAQLPYVVSEGIIEAAGAMRAHHDALGEALGMAEASC